MSEPMIIVYDARESVVQSISRDLMTFGGLVGSAIVLNTEMPPSGWINAALAICWILWMFGRATARKMRKTPAEARAWLDQEYPTPEGEAA